jgi:hypothetical protein
LIFSKNIYLWLYIKIKSWCFWKSKLWILRITLIFAMGLLWCCTCIWFFQKLFLHTFWVKMHSKEPQAFINIWITYMFFFLKIVFSYEWIIEWLFLQLVMKNDYNFFNKSIIFLNQFLINMNL